ncbi:RagB/SusD family nutrient uptake outer membrane protein [Chitinophaga rhizosphaerae]|uniref:RagB/SusD family nutrient uptake outer membrane protein n=1 Tax=Chitinophaga rhizosphaerae TaxID=1864947 RepID=UPI000F808861|nr:RagB/SusD family nutrient uptake outer membrane protein [Chitinophaga rhizosphaerae]
MKRKIFALLFAATLAGGCKKEFLVRMPLDQLTDQTYWSSEENVRAFAYRFYAAYFPGFSSGYTWANYTYLGQGLNDDFSPETPNPFTKQVPNSSSNWGFIRVRDANLMLARVQAMPNLQPAARDHWMGVARFFRAMAYYQLVNDYGDVQWYDRTIDIVEEKELFKPRDARTVVMDHMQEDLEYAAAKIRAEDGATGLNVTKWVALAFMSRIMLFEGTWQKYQAANNDKSKKYLEAAKWAANEIITKGNFSFSHGYRLSFNSLDLASNKEMIMYRSYMPGLLTHSMMSYVNTDAQVGPSKNLVESYLCKDGLPIGLSPLYKGDKTIADVLTDRDPRLRQTVAPALRPNGSKGRFNNYATSSSGYAHHKFLNEEIATLPNGTSNLNDTDAPVIRYGEVLMNYAEACAELGTLSQADLDKSINILRARPVDNANPLPPLQVVGGQPAVNGVAYDDPARDPGVPALIWEIRRERRVELSMEGFRLDDLRRWKKMGYADTRANSDINRGAWIKRSEWEKAGGGSWLVNITLTGADEGYIIPSVSANADRIFDNERVYLTPIPADQIKIFSDKGYELKQNPLWSN